MSASAVVNPVIFREYIGLEDNIDDFPAEMINDNMKEFHFILCFATDRYVDGKGTGDFDRTWNIKSFSAQNVAKLKKNHKNVKVIISIGGNGPQDQFNPKDNEDWIVKAKLSIKGIILDYKNQVPDEDIIDGIDINYEKITSSVNDFSNCIGQLIQQLKDDPDVSKSISVVSIAPTELLQSYYLKLFLDNKQNIDWIDYKFYSQYFEKRDDVVDLFKILVSRDKYDTAFDKLLVGVGTFEAIQSKIIIDGIIDLLKTASLAGVFVWDSKTSASPYVTEKKIQKLLAKK